MLGIFKFENNQVEVTTDEVGNPLFELYSTGMALGQVKIAKGIAYPRKDRIDTNIKNAGISTVVRNGQQYLTESQLYDFMLEAKTKKCLAFRKWVVSDVLPTIRKTGGYINKNATPRQLKKLKDNIKELEEENARLDYKLATHLISTKQVSLLGSTINYRAGLAGAARADLVKKDMVRELRHKFSISAYGDLQEYQFNDAMNFINHYPVTPDNTKVTRLANFGK